MASVEVLSAFEIENNEIDSDKDEDRGKKKKIMMKTELM